MARGERAREDVRLRSSARSWYEIRAAQVRDATRGEAAPTYAEVYLYDEIGMWGISAGDFITQVNALEVDEIDLHINSPGGDLFDGVAIYQALVAHPATCLVYVDALAASIASVIAMAGERITMAQMSRMFIHDAWGVCVGNATDMRSMADRLDDFSGMIAGAYAARAGGTPAQWRKRMQAETWFSPQQAVEAGLADEISKPAKPEEEEAAALLAPAAARRQHDAETYPWLRPAAEGEDAGEESPPASPATPAAPADPQPVEDPGDDEDEEEAGPTLADVDLAGLLQGDATPTPPEPLEDGLLAAALEHEWNHAPAAPVTPAPPPAPPAEDFGQALSSALQEAFQQ